MASRLITRNSFRFAANVLKIRQKVEDTMNTKTYGEPPVLDKSNVTQSSSKYTHIDGNEIFWNAIRDGLNGSMDTRFGAFRGEIL